MARTYNRKSNKHRKRRMRNSTKWIIVIITVVLIAAVALGIGATVNKVNDIVVNNQYDEILNVNTCYNGIYVDDIHIGGMTRDEAKAKIEENQRAQVEAIKVDLTFESLSWEVTGKDINYSFDTDTVLNQAFEVGRSGDLDQRYNTVISLPDNPLKFYTTMTTDASPLQTLAVEIADSLYLEPVDATLLTFNPAASTESERFSYSPDQPGRQADANAIFAALKESIESKSFNTVSIEVTPLEANVKVGDLKGNIVKLASYTSKQTNDKNRMSNIALACSAVSGKIIMPGEVFSFNETTGPRTEAKGYKEAGIISSGEPDVGLGGGVCQVSGTLFNAVLRADLEIVTRTRHSYVLAYLPAGLDATVDYPNTDFKFRNNTKAPIYLFMTSSSSGDRPVTAEIYGLPRTDGLSIEMVTKVTERTEPTTVDHKVDKELAPGKTRTVSAKTGVRVEVYKKYVDSKGNQVGELVLSHKDNYPPINKKVYHAPGELPSDPTAAPKTTPTPKPTSKPTPTPTPDKPDDPADTPEDKTVEPPSDSTPEP